MKSLMPHAPFPFLLLLRLFRKEDSGTAIPSSFPHNGFRKEFKDRLIHRRGSHGSCRSIEHVGPNIQRISLTFKLPPRRISRPGSGLLPVNLLTSSFSPDRRRPGAAPHFIPDIVGSRSGAISLHGVGPGSPEDILILLVRVTARSLARISRRCEECISGRNPDLLHLFLHLHLLLSSTSFQALRHV